MAWLNSKNQVMTEDPKKGYPVVAGVVIGDEFWKMVKPEHYMRDYGGYGISSDVFPLLEELMIPTIILNGPDFNISIPVKDWLSRGFSGDEKKTNGPQIFLKWEIIREYIKTKSQC